MTAPARVLDVLVGLSVLGWAAAGVAVGLSEPSLTTARVVAAALNLTVGVLFLVRRPLQRDGTRTTVLASLPSFVAGGLAFKLAVPLAWPAPAQVVFALAAILVIASLTSLGRCFAIFPAARGVVDGGPYGLVRHPAYLGEALLVITCASVHSSVTLAWLPVVFLATLVARIRCEESLLLDDGTYRAYVERVRWRLLPGVW